MKRWDGERGGGRMGGLRLSRPSGQRQKERRADRKHGATQRRGDVESHGESAVPECDSEPGAVSRGNIVAGAATMGRVSWLSGEIEAAFAYARLSTPCTSSFAARRAGRKLAS